MTLPLPAAPTPPATERRLQDYPPLAGYTAPPPGAREAPLPRVLRPILSLDDFETAARRHLPRPVFAYVAGGCETDRSMRANRRQFAAYDWVPRTFVDTGRRSLATELFGRRWSAPFGIAPMGISALSAYRGDLVQTAAAREAGLPHIMSGSSLIRLEAVAAANPDAWFQAYVPTEEARMLALVDRAGAAGFRTLVITADVPVAGNRENNIRAGFSTPLRPDLRLAWQGLTHPRWLLGTALRTLLRHGMPHFENNSAQRGAPILASNVARDFGARDRLSWAHLATIRRRWPHRLVVKGLLSVDDAVRARDEGADGVIVSNHGGRQLDGAVAPLHVLPAIVDAVGAGCPVMVDSGFRRGTDVLMALALGARFVFVGRPFNYAGAVAGEAGIAHAIGILATEIDRDMAMLGVNAVGELGRAHLRPAAWREGATAPP